MRWVALASWIIAAACAVTGIVFLALGSWSGIAMLINAGTFTINGFTFRTLAGLKQLRRSAVAEGSDA